jgi:hypothetical protein
MTESMIRGYSIRRTVAFIESHFDGVERARALESFTEAQWQEFRRCEPAGWYPRKHSGALLSAVAAAKNDPTGSFADLVECGRFVANEALNVALRLLLKITSPERLASKLNDVWHRDQRGGDFVSQNVSSHSVELVLTNVDDYPHIGPASVGFFYSMWAAMGKKATEVRQEGWTLERPAPRQVHFFITWSR